MNALQALAGDTPVATTLLALIVVASLVGLKFAPGWLDRQLFRPYHLLRRGEYATLVTSAFVHADLAHLLFNGFTLWAFGFGLERRLGSGAFLALYAIGIAVSDLGTWLRHRHDPGYRCLGASGAILAVLFASIVVAPTQSIFVLPIPVPIPAPLFALGYLAYSVYASRQARGRVNHDAHLGGAVAGLLFVALVDPAAFARAGRTWWQMLG